LAREYLRLDELLVRPLAEERLKPFVVTEEGWSGRLDGGRGWKLGGRLGARLKMGL